MLEKGQRIYVMFVEPAYQQIKKLAKRDKESLSFKVGALVREALVSQGELALPTPKGIE